MTEANTVPNTAPKIIIAPLTADDFIPFGQVIQTEGAAHHAINAGRAKRYHDLARVELGGVHARPLISIVRGQPYALPLTLKLMERHPLGSQAFYPLSARPYLVIAALDRGGAPDTPRAFLARPDQGINIAMNTWHGVLTPLGAISDFLVIDRGGEGDNLEEHVFETPWILAEDD